ncbi:hypothetical protein Sme01_25640 [Sphaerisporangium melleum]|uniref:Histidine kinase/HSP90-like ATPase domain-containing protein n=1 Tax=Sphaerisporangium melleum TaxID=321316 RepID=A0A917QS05_9ACTN|nr:hypothetical protein GCM10007964_04300 [Sphaerisporangium melleum]GII70088.1 hypothetical protein Sme01_25640 [Sphaerisporangium melleum]
MNLTIRNTDRTVRVEVSDEGSATSVPHVRNEPEAEGGRGLHIISALAKEWGVTHRKSGVTIWCEVSTGDGASDP